MDSNMLSTSQSSLYPIGTPGQAWGEQEKSLWLNQQIIQRSYAEQVLALILDSASISAFIAANTADTKASAAIQSNPHPEITPELELVHYHTLAYNTLHQGASDYPVYLFKSRHWDETKPNVLITGGVHGYETSGVHGAIRFLRTKAQQYCQHANLVIVPCLSPWGYETINRWNPNAIDPNRSFTYDTDVSSDTALQSNVQEAHALMAALSKLTINFQLHIDLHETTDSDNAEFRPALAARDGKSYDNWDIPDGFYLVGDTLKPQAEFQKAIIHAVSAITHIAPAGEQARLIGVPIAQFGVINYPTKALGLCAGMTDAPYCTTTEVYPDSPLVDDENCILAQVAAITSAIDFILKINN
ncbi:M14 family metallocarboxypeptidase [Shewanella sp. SR44-3]|uniref:M14 family metallopeptidase n=1 Tax=Shewanella sp. SR44-3 TaxID=2760936 RepID=UPI0015FD0D78|nr:M14 family metallocarboxypeptidase [Shewanella sp. SR44-3]MBB1271143.1 M14 family metallocarboxypeptidase [Shewanella sp. SR44-3]